MFRLEEILKEKKITKGELAKMLGISKQSIPNLLNGNPTKARLEEVARALDVPTWQLFVSPEEIAHTDNELSALVVYNNIPHEAHSLLQLKEIVSDIEQDILNRQ